MNHHSLLNQAPALVAFGLRTGLLSVRPSAPANPIDKYRDQQRESARQGMRKLRAQRAENISVNEK